MIDALRWVLPMLLVAGAARADRDPAWELYDAAFGQAAHGHRDEARETLRALIAQWPDHPAARRATTLIAELAPAAPSRISNVARGELVFWSTLGGVFVANNVCVIADCHSDREKAGVYIAGVGGSLALALLASRNGVEQGEAQLYNSAQTWGSWNGLGLNDGFANASDEAGVALGAQAVGLAAGLGLWQTWHPTQGDVALTNTFFLWSTVLSIWGHVASDSDVTVRRVVIAGDIGIVAGALVSTKVKMSRGRTLLIDVGGLLGILAGGLVAAGGDSESTTGTALLVGNAAGLILATVATKDWDIPDPPKQLTLVPTRLVDPHGRGSWGVGAGFQF